MMPPTAVDPPNQAFITQRGGQLADAPARSSLSQLEELESIIGPVPATSQATLLLKKKKEMREVADALQLMKDEYDARMKACGERQRQFERKQVEMKEQVTRFEKFIQENDSKWRRAELKVKAERQATELKQSELQHLQQALDKAEEHKGCATDELARLRHFKDYLEVTVTASNGENTEISELLNRFRTLRDANQDLMQQVQRSDADTDRLRAELHALRTETQNSILVMNSEINLFQKRLDTKRAENKASVELKEREEESVNEVNRETWQVIMAIRNLYTRCAASMRTRIPGMNWDQFISDGDQPIDSADLQRTLEACLRIIRERIRDLNGIVHEGEGQLRLSLQAHAEERHESTTLPPISQETPARPGTGEPR